MLPVQFLDTRVLPPADRYDLWLEIVASSAPAFISSPHAARFDAHARSIELGGLRITDFTYPSLTMTRTPKLIRQVDPEMYQLALTRVGNGTVSQQRQEASVRPGEFILLDNSRPFVARHDAPPGELLNAVTVNIPHAALPVPPAKLAVLLGASMSGSTGVGGLLAPFLLQIAAHPEQFADADASHLGSITVDLVSAMLLQQIGAETALPPETRHHALRRRVDTYIADNLHDPELGPRSIAAAHHISLRTLHRLFAGEDATVAELVRRRRLERCRDDLTDPRMRARPVQAIGARWGFLDKTHFSRLFRATYGLSPQAYREQNGGEASP
ncbi:helix-turn-helix domain-containing protein [Micromonospora chersina]|uniref:AraC-like ligand-binding domain-containing protein n=1 Tax=Micromonospora chersina TaxID=47854 RepID=UPI0033CA6E95